MIKLNSRSTLLITLFFCSLFLQSQNISFTAHTVDENFDGPGGIFISDINNDGYNDILSAGMDANTIAWWQNDTLAQQDWQKHIIDSDFNGAISVFVTEIDNDGLVDVLGASYYGNEIAWWHNGGGSPIQWTKQKIDSGFVRAHEVMGFDIDSDGDMDVIGVSAQLNIVAWYENDGNSTITWTKHIIDSLFTGARSIDAADIDDDGDIDIVGAALDDDEVAWWRNDGGTPIQWTKFSISTNFMLSHKVQITDIDLDGDLDILGTAYSSGISWWRNDGGDPIIWEKQLVSGNNSLVIAWAIDLDLDSDNDLVGSAQGSGYMAFWENEDDNSLNWDFNYMESFVGAWPLYYGDLDNDGDLDLACGGNESNEIRMYTNDLITSSSISTATDIKFRCLPNPASETIVIQYFDDSKYPVNIMIYSVSGELLISQNVKSKSDHIDISMLPKGMYIISVNEKGVSEREKLIIN